MGMARICRGIKTVLWFLCLSDSFLSVMNIFSGFLVTANQYCRCCYISSDRLVLLRIYNQVSLKRPCNGKICQSDCFQPFNYSAQSIIDQ